MDEMILGFVTPFKIADGNVAILLILEEIDELDDSVGLDVFLMLFALRIGKEFAVVLQVAHGLC